MKDYKLSKYVFSLGVAVLVFTFVVSIVNAYSGDFSFDIIASVQGSYKHTLASNKGVTITSEADTYTNSYDDSDHKEKYNIGLKRKGSLWPETTSYISADGYLHTCKIPGTVMYLCKKSYMARSSQYIDV